MVYTSLMFGNKGVLKHAHACPRMFRHAHICPRMLRHAHACSCMPTHDHAFSDMLKHAPIALHYTQNVVNSEISSDRNLHFQDTTVNGIIKVVTVTVQ